MKKEQWLITDESGEQTVQTVHVFQLTAEQINKFPELAACQFDKFGVYKTFDFSGKAYWSVVHESGGGVSKSLKPERMRDILNDFPRNLALNIRIMQRHGSTWQDVKNMFAERQVKRIENNKKFEQGGLQALYE